MTTHQFIERKLHVAPWKHKMESALYSIYSLVFALEIARILPTRQRQVLKYLTIKYSM